MGGFWTLLAIVAGFLVWFAERRLEMKVGIFNDVVKALILFEVDATNQKLQKENYKVDENKTRGYPFLRDETLALTGRCSGLVNAFFSQDASRAFDNAIYSVSLKEGKDGKPIIRGIYDLGERKKIISDLSKELSIPFILRECFCSLISYARLKR